MARGRLITVLLVVCAVEAAAARAEAVTPGRTLLVTDTRCVATATAAGRLVQARIATLAARSSRYEVRTLADALPVADVDHMRRTLDCDGADECAAKAASALEHDLVLSTTLGQLGSTLVLTLALIDARSVSVIARATASGDGFEALSASLEATIAAVLGDAPPAAPFHLPSGAPTSFAVLDLEAVGVAKEMAKNLTEILSVELKRVEGTSVIARADLVALVSLEQMKHVLEGECDTSCLAEVGGALGVDKIVVGQVGRLAETYVVTLQLVDPRVAKVDHRVVESFVGDDAQLIRSVRHAARSLLGLTGLEPGLLAVAGSENGATVEVDGKAAGALPLPPIEAVASGRHALRVTRDGYEDWRSDVYVDPNETTAVWAQLTERPTRWYRTWWFWTLVGTAAAAGTATAIALGQQAPATGTVVVDIVPRE